jgi:hypothetical protein
VDDGRKQKVEGKGMRASEPCYGKEGWTDELIHRKEKIHVRGSESRMRLESIKA